MDVLSLHLSLPLSPTPPFLSPSLPSPPPGSSRDWSHVTRQIGMFCYTGLNQEQVEKLREEHAVYMTKDGRLSVVSLTPDNVESVARAIHLVSK